MVNIKFFTPVLSALMLAACGGGGNTTGGGAGSPTVSNKCAINNLSLSSGTQASLNKSSDSLSASMNITMQETLMVDISTNFESSAADDWIEGYPYVEMLSAGNNSVTLVYDLNSPRKQTSDRYTKLTVLARLPGNEACVTNIPVNILLDP